MCKYQTGDVVWGLAFYSDGLGVKPRPVIILEVKDSPCRYRVVECSTLKEKHNSGSGIIIKLSDPRSTECGFDEDTCITKTKAWMNEKLLKPHPTRGDNPIGKCKFLAELI